MRPQTTATVTLADGTPIHLSGWPAPEESSVVLVIQHGLGEHSGRYASFVGHLAEVPIHVWSFDSRGHGHSGGKQGHADRLEQLAADLDEILPMILDRSGASRVVLYGHSLGAAVVGWYLTRHPPHEAIVASWMSSIPASVDRTLEIRIKDAAGTVLDSVAPSLTLPSGLRAQDISSVPAEVERYTSDPLVHGMVSVRLGRSVLHDTPRVVDGAQAITMPVLMWHGAEDHIASAAGSQEAFARLGSADKTLRIFPEARHEVHHETPETVGELFEMLRTWLSERSLTGR